MPLTAASSTYDESLKLKVVPYSLFTVSGGIASTGGYVDPATGTAKSVRIDQPSVALKTLLSNPASANGQHVSSGVGVTPASSAFTAYDHTQSLLSNSDLQMLNGRFTSPSADPNAYKAYSSDTYYSGTAALPLYNYSTITSATGGSRYVTFKFSNALKNGESKIQFSVSHTNLLLGANLSSSNHSCQILVDDTAQPTLLMDCNQPIAASGLGTGTPGNNTPCGDISSTTSVRKCYIPAGSSVNAILFVRVGIPNNVAATITSISLAAVSVFT